MKKIKNVLILGLFIAIALMGTVGCTSVENKFSKDDFEDEMIKRGHEYKFIDENMGDNLLGEKSIGITLDDNITLDGKQYILYDVHLIVNYYESNEEMEKSASKINKDASVVTSVNGIPIDIEWGKTPHFYKKGTIIVRYEGADEKIINDLEEIMGEQFAGIE